MSFTFSSPTSVGVKNTSLNNNTLAPSAPQGNLTNRATNPSQQIGPTGLKFPFRFATGGRCGVSTTTPNNPAHITESIEQILFTNIRERFFNADFGSRLMRAAFEPQTTVTNVLRIQLVKALSKWEPRIRILSMNVTVDSLNNAVFGTLSYQVTIFKNSPTYTQKFQVAA